MVTTKNDLEKKLKEVKPFLRKKFGVNKIGFFGSFASGRQTPGSDVDILVDFSEKIGWNFFDLKDYLEYILDREVDLVTKRSIREKWKASILKEIHYV